jgi:CheY-like chemotaxis protein
MPPRILVVDDSPTIRTVVSTILERNGYDPKVASDGEDALSALTSGEVQADLVLVDFVMPHMNGEQFCKALRTHAELASMPVILMSAKADTIRNSFVERTGALDAITKPFDAKALVAVIEQSLRRVNAARSSARLPAHGTEELPVLPPDAPSKKPTLPNPEPITSADLPILAGDLGAVPIGAILQLLQAENQTGVLVCTNASRDAFGAPSAEIRATFRDGAIDLVQSTGAGDEFRLGRFFVEEGILRPAEIESFLRELGPSGDGPPWPWRPTVAEALAAPTVILSAEAALEPWKAKAARPPLGMALVAAGKITDAQLRSALTRQSCELLYEVLRWRGGRFELRREPPSELAGAKLGLPVASVVMEGFRRVDEWRALERALGSFDSVLYRDDTAFGTLEIASLPLRERIVLDAVDGERTVRAIIAASHLSSFEACRILVQLIEARAVRRRAG